MTNQVSIQVRITNQEIDDIMTTALEGGINYWCGQAVVAEQPKHSVEWASDVISQGGKLKLWDSEDEKWLILDKAAFKKGFAMAKSDGNGFDLEQYDSTDADRVIQYALFDKLVYA